MSAKIKAGEAYVELGTKGSIKAGLRRASRAVVSFGAQVAKVGAGITSAMAAAGVAATVSFVKAGSELQKLSVQTGASVEALSRLQFAARKLQIDPDDMTGAIEELNIRLGETIRDGVGPAAEAFKQLGLDATELANVPLDQRLQMIAGALAKVRNPAQRGFLSDEIFGGDAFKILPLIDKGAEGIAALTAEADKLGATMSGSQAAAAQELLDAWTTVKASVAGVVMAIGKELAPTLLAFVDMALPKLTEMGTFFRESGAEIFGAAVSKSAQAFTGVLRAFHEVKRVFNFVKLGLNSLILLAVEGMNNLVSGIVKTVNTLIEVLNKIPRVDIDFRMSDDNAVSGFLDAMSTNLRDELKSIHADLDKTFEPPKFIDDYNAAVEQRQEQLDGPSGGVPVAPAPAELPMLGDDVADYISDMLKMGIEKLNGIGGEGVEIGSRGTFSSAAAASLGRSGDVDQKQLETLRKNQETLDKIRRFISKRGPLLWGAF